MKKICLFSAFCAFLLMSCSYSVEEILLLPTKTPTYTPSPFLSPTNTFTYTPTLPTPTFTDTPTLIGARSPTPTLPPTFTGTPTLPFVEITPNTPTPTIQMSGFVSIKASDIVFYFGKGCEPNFIRFDVIVSDPKKAGYVVLSARFKSKTSGVTSEWNGLTMESRGLGLYEYDLYPENMKAVDAYENPWVEYQFVVTTQKRIEIGRTGVFEEKLSLLRCLPTPTATTEPSATPKKP